MFLNKKTKIIATIGPLSGSEAVLEKMIALGVDAIRLNFSHGDYREKGFTIKKVREVGKKLGTYTAIIADIQGPKIRVGTLPKNGLTLKDNQEIIIDCNKREFKNNHIPVPSKTFRNGTPVGSKVFLDDGTIIIKITAKKDSTFKAVVLKGGILFSKKGINVPMLSISGSVLSSKDKSDIRFATRAKVDYIALSFLRNAKDVKEAKKFINDPNIKIIAKIERPEAIFHIDEITDEADVIMIARGDLGIETPLWELPVRQKEIVEKVRKKIKPVIIATQMLDSMIRNPLPTRAEVSDVANAAYDGADAVMLSGETASGKNPLEAVEMMRKVLTSTEHSQRYVKDYNPAHSSIFLSIAKSAADIASEVNAKAIFVETLGGQSAKIISHFRPKNTIVALTNNERTAHQLSLVWGVMPILFKNKKIKTIDDLVLPGISILTHNRFLKKGDIILCAYDEKFKLSKKADVSTITIKLI